MGLAWRRSHRHCFVRTRHVAGSVVRADAAGATADDDRAMAHAEHRQEDLPVTFETATVGEATSRGVISCPPETPLRVVARMMTTYGVHAIFVFDPVGEADGAPH